jgi:hypothetical protein
MISRRYVCLLRAAALCPHRSVGSRYGRAYRRIRITDLKRTRSATHEPPVFERPVHKWVHGAVRTGRLVEAIHRWGPYA